ncbi:unnamed protein product [Phyllotreta striolata]|uniref:Cytochrome b-c1 complex subunit Rieske, mitochondrial n=1 Tax=Phyllotreta striolata TaxID=444603 RepID=A0A9N9XQC4_PHYSR|nr:unnamed protein product [Phyllotreta striolata]
MFTKALRFNVRNFKYYAASPRLFARAAHTDYKVPDFDEDRKESLQCPTMRSSDSEDRRRGAVGLITLIGGALAMYGTKAEIHRYVLFMGASADVLALAKIEVNLSEIPEGKSATFKWRGKPIFVRRRSPDQIRSSEKVPLSELRDPATDDERCPNKKFLVIIGICTHLGCVPIADAGDYGPGGYYCPCHGSHFDASGRIRKGPANTNMDIPEHTFVDENTLVIG